MKVLEGKKEKKPKGHKRLGFYLVGLTICVMVVIALIRFGTVLFLAPVWSWLSNSVVNATGVNIWLAKAFSALLILPLIYIYSMVFSWRKKKRQIGIVLLSVCTALICVSMFFVTKDTYFSFKSGQANKWYIITPQGDYKFSTSPGFDPVWGKPYKLVTPEVIENYMRQKQGSSTRLVLPGEQDLGDIILKKNSVLSPEDALSIVEKVKAMINGQYEYSVLDDYLITLKENTRCSHFFCWILEKNYNSAWSNNYNYVKKIIGYIREEKSVNSLPTLMVVYQNSADSRVREYAKEAYTFIKTGKGFVTSDVAEAQEDKLAVIIALIVLLFIFILAIIKIILS
jgi:hypothetical protein